VIIIAGNTATEMNGCKDKVAKRREKLLLYRDC
jgi:hypothetical protein